MIKQSQLLALLNRLYPRRFLARDFRKVNGRIIYFIKWSR